MKPFLPWLFSLAVLCIFLDDACLALPSALERGNLLRDSGFESRYESVDRLGTPYSARSSYDVSAKNDELWQPFVLGATPSIKQRLNGDRSMKTESTHEAVSGFYQRIPHQRLKPRVLRDGALTLSAWVNQRNGGDSHAVIDIDISFRDGSISYGHKLTWANPDPAHSRRTAGLDYFVDPAKLERRGSDWEHRCMILDGLENVQSITVHAYSSMPRAGYSEGEIFWDDFRLLSTRETTVHDTACVVASAPTLNDRPGELARELHHPPHVGRRSSGISTTMMGRNDVTLVTAVHSSDVSYLAKLLSAWNGPASVVLYLSPHDDEDQVLSTLDTKVTGDGMRHATVQVLQQTSSASTGEEIPSYIPHALNLAIGHSKTRYSLFVDDGFVPPVDAHSTLQDGLSDITRIVGAHGVVMLPAIEVLEGSAPSDKSALLKMAQKRSAWTARHPTYRHGPTSTILQTWLTDGDTEYMQGPKYAPLYAPYLIFSTADGPRFQERMLEDDLYREAFALEAEAAHRTLFVHPTLFLTRSAETTRNGGARRHGADVAFKGTQEEHVLRWKKWYAAVIHVSQKHSGRASQYRLNGFGAAVRPPKLSLISWALGMDSVFHFFFCLSFALTFTAFMGRRYCDLTTGAGKGK